MKHVRLAALPLLLACLCLACLLGAALPVAAAEPPVEPAAEPSAPPTGPITGYATQEKIIFLTFDDGPFAPWTQQILDMLAKHEAHATFFIIGRQAVEDPAILQAIYDGGHGLGNHSYNHANLSGVSWQFFDAEVGDTGDLLGDLDSGCLRPPYGAVDGNTLPYAEDAGYTVVKWNMDPRDWAQPGAGVIASHVIKNAQPGSIVVMHDGGGDRSQTVAALDILIPRLKRQGYSFKALCRDVTPEELVAASLALPEATPTIAPAPDPNAPGPLHQSALQMQEDAPGETPEPKAEDARAPQPDGGEEAPPVPTTPASIYGRIAFPHAGAAVRGPVLVQGSADHPAFEKWQLDLVLPSGEEIFLAIGDKPMRNANKLHVWDTRLYPNGPAMLRLRVVHAGDYEEYFVHVVIEN